MSEGEREESLSSCRELTDTIYDELDVTGEIRAIDTQGLGDTLLLWDEGHLVGVAACHWGAGTEAGSGAYYIKFGAIRPGSAARENFERLLDTCEALASIQGLRTLAAGTNMGRHEAYRTLRARGFRTELQAVTMHRPNELGYSRPDVYVIDDWR